MGNEWGKDHASYDRQREAAKLEQQRQDALRKAAGKDKTPEQIRKDQAALNAFYDNRAKANKRRGGKPDTCAVLLLGMLTGVAGAAYGVAEALRWIV